MIYHQPWHYNVFTTITHIINSEIIQRLGDLNLLLGIKESVCELLALSQSTLNDLEARYIAQVVADRLVWVISGRMGV